MLLVGGRRWGDGTNRGRSVFELEGITMATGREVLSKHDSEVFLLFLGELVIGETSTSDPEEVGFLKLLPILIIDEVATQATTSTATSGTNFGFASTWKTAVGTFDDTSSVIDLGLLSLPDTGIPNTVTAEHGFGEKTIAEILFGALGISTEIGGAMIVGEIGQAN